MTHNLTSLHSTQSQTLQNLKLFFAKILFNFYTISTQNTVTTIMLQLSMLSVLGLYVGWTVRLIGKICKHSVIYVTFVAVKYKFTKQ